MYRAACVVTLLMCATARAGDAPPPAKPKPTDATPTNTGADKPTPKVATSAQRCDKELIAANAFGAKACSASEFNLAAGRQLICIQADGGCIYDSQIDGEHVDVTALAANRSIAIVVHAAKGEKVAIAMDGAIGETVPMTFTAPPSGNFAYIIGDNGKAAEPKEHYYVAYFAPRKAGAASLSVVVTPSVTKVAADILKKLREPVSEDDAFACALSAPTVGDLLDCQSVGIDKFLDDRKKANAGNNTPKAQTGSPITCRWAICNVSVAPMPSPTPPTSSHDDATTPKPETYVYELYVPTVYGGALRLGFGALLVPDLGHSYSLRTSGTSGLGQIVDTGASPFAMEIVVGYAPFLFDRGSHFGGRVYGSFDKPCHWAPYFGLGALSTSGTSKVDWLRSLYLGLEYELTPGSSIAVTGVVRRLDALSDNLHLGDVVATGTSVTTTRFAFGGAIVFNFTPAFFKFASSALPN